MRLDTSSSDGIAYQVSTKFRFVQFCRYLDPKKSFRSRVVVHRSTCRIQLHQYVLLGHTSEQRGHSTSSPSITEWFPKCTHSRTIVVILQGVLFQWEFRIYEWRRDTAIPILPARRVFHSVALMGHLSWRASISNRNRYSNRGRHCGVHQRRLECHITPLRLLNKPPSVVTSNPHITTSHCTGTICHLRDLHTLKCIRHHLLSSWKQKSALLYRVSLISHVIDTNTEPRFWLPHMETIKLRPIRSQMWVPSMHRSTCQ